MTATVHTLSKPNPGAMRQHVEHLFGGYLDGFHDGLIELSWTDIKPDESGKHPLRSARLFKTDQIDDLLAEAQRLNSQPMCNVYIGAALRKPSTAPFGRAKDSDCLCLTAAYVDLDDDGAVKAAGDICMGKLVKPTLIVVTGHAPHKRAQVWWRLDEPATDPEQWSALLKGMAGSLRGDPTVSNPSRVMRLAGSIAWPVKEGRTVEMTQIVPLTEPGQNVYSLSHLAALFPPIYTVGGATRPVQSPAPGVTHKTNSLGLPSDIIDGRESYMRDTLAAALIEYVGTNGSAPTPEDLFEAAWPQYERNVDLSRPGRGREEFARKCAYTVGRFLKGEIRGIPTLDAAIDIYRNKTQAQRAAPRPEPVHQVDASHIRATPFEWPESIPPRRWIYGRHYIREFVSTTVAPGGVGKSSLIIAEAIAIVTGREILKIKVDEPTNVWMWNGEDPRDELNRRIVAVAKHHKVRPEELAGLFVDTGRETPIIIAERTRDGVVINAPVVDQVIATITANNIGVFMVDPFIASHRVTENDNNEIDRVAKVWAHIADETGCSIELVHHVRKSNGNEVQVEDGRGAVALLAAARAARTLNRMTKEEGDRAGIENHRFFFRADDGKANLAPPSTDATWFQMVSYDLENGVTKEVDGSVKRPSDKVGVPEGWEWPDPMEDVTANDVEIVRERVRDERWKADPQAKNWVGFLIIDVLGKDRKDTSAKAQAAVLQKVWIEKGALKVVREKDDDYKEKPFIRPGENK
jgi:hypothetical protein